MMRNSPEARAKMSAARKGKPLSREAKLKLSKTLTGRPLTEEWKAKIAASHKGKRLSEEHKQSVSNGARRAWAAYDEKVHAKTLRTYGLSLNDFKALLAKQKNGCAICRKPISAKDRTAYVDHDHNTGKVRGLLCRSCNTGLGLLGDSEMGLRIALEYLTRA